MSAQIGPGIQGAYEGFFKGLDMVQNAKQKSRDMDWTAQQRERDQAMWQQEDAYKSARINDAMDDLSDKQQLRPQVQEFRTRKLSTDMQELGNTSKKQELEAAKLDNDKKHLPQVLTDMDIARELHSAQTGQQALSAFMQLGGKALSMGDLQGVTKIMGHMVKARLIDAGGLGVPVSTHLVNIPKDEGAVDFAGNPIAGQALKIITDQGAEAYVNPAMMNQAYRQSLQQQQAEQAKVLKPGEKWVTPDGQTLAEGAPRVTGGIVVDPETGEVIDMRPRTAGAGGGAGSSSRAGGKGDKPKVDLAKDVFDTISQKGEYKLSPDEISSGYVYTSRAAAHDWLTPEEAAYVGHKVASQGEKALTPFLDPYTLEITGAYSDPQVQGGRPVPLAPGQMTLEEFAATPVGKAQGQKAITAATEQFLRNFTPAQNDEQLQAGRNLIAQAASDDAVYDQLMATLEGGNPTKVERIKKLIHAHRVFGAPSAAKQQPAKPAPAPAAAAQPLGGLSAPPTNDAGGLPMGGLQTVSDTAEPAAVNPMSEQAAAITPQAIEGMSREDVRRILNNAPLMRALNSEQRNALQMRFSLAPN